MLQIFPLYIYFSFHFIMFLQTEVQFYELDLSSFLCLFCVLKGYFLPH